MKGQGRPGVKFPERTPEKGTDIEPVKSDTVDAVCSPSPALLQTVCILPNAAKDFLNCLNC